jgi:hypothetical protein
MSLDKPGTTPYKCSDGTSGSGVPNFPVITGVSEESGSAIYSTVDGSFKSGFIIKEKPKVLFTTELVNYSNTTKNVFAVSELDYLPGHPEGYSDSGFALLSVTQCDGTNPLLHPPEGQKRYSYKSKVLTIIKGGHILETR